MLKSHFNFQDETGNAMLFTPVVENHLGEGDEAFLTDYPKNILLSKKLELVPWMVGLTSGEGALMLSILSELSPAGETKLVHKKCLINFCHLGTAMFTVTRRT